MVNPQSTKNAEVIADLSAATITFDEQARQIVLVKHDQRYVFRYEPGAESKLLAHVVELVQRPDNNLDWFDAAMLSHKVGSRMCRQYDRILKAG